MTLKIQASALILLSALSACGGTTSDCADDGGACADGGTDTDGSMGTDGGGTTGDGGGTGTDGGGTGSDGGGTGTDGGGTGSDGGGTNGDAHVPPSGAWKNVTSNLAGMDADCGNLSGLSAKPDEDLLIAGVAGQGLWASDDGGGSWSQLAQGAGSEKITNRMIAIVYDPAHTKTWWEAGIYGTGVFVTKDDGDTFTGLGKGTPGSLPTVNLVAVDFTDPDRKVMLAGGHENQNTLVRSDDGGNTWANALSNIPSGASCTWPAILDTTTYLVGCSYYGEGIYRSTDSAQSWKPVSDSGGISAPLVASDGTIYWARPNYGGLMRSTDDGKTWTQVTGEGVLSAGITGGISPIELPDGRIAMLGVKTIVASEDQGASWYPVSVDLPYGDVSGFVYSKQQRAFFVKHVTCGPGGTPAPVPNDAIMRFDYDYQQ